MDKQGSTLLPAFGLRLRTLRRARGIKQDDLARRIGVDQASISRWERGDRLPTPALGEQAFRKLAEQSECDSPLKRLVTASKTPIHLIEDISHRCLAASSSRLREWGMDPEDVLGVNLWQFATPEIEAAEAALASQGWWDTYAPTAPAFSTSGHTRNGLSISAGVLLWERLYLQDGTPVRLCTTLSVVA